ncbi:MAG: YibE/F family protein [Desulfatibacillum sp.]|nr:YibE/F family protein [Desulfatibacillum sp.]
MSNISSRARGAFLKRDMILSLFFVAMTVIIMMLPTGFSNRGDANALGCKGEVLETDNSLLRQFGIVRMGAQSLEVKLLSGPFKGEVVSAENRVTGKMDLDKIFLPGDKAYMVLSVKDGAIHYANAMDHYRLDVELILLSAFFLLLILFGGWTGTKAIVSFIFSAAMIWKVMVPLFLKGYNPILVAVAIVVVVSAAVIFLVGGLTKQGLVAFGGAIAGVTATCILALVFGGAFKLHGAVRPFSETLLYSGYADLSLTRIFLASVFIASAGAVMDLAMDVSSAMNELAQKRPDMGFGESLKSGMTVGRAVVGTMTTTLLFAYSGGYITLLMVFMAQGVSLSNLFNLNYVSAEILNTLVGSFGLITVAPFTALIGALVFARGRKGCGEQLAAGDTTCRE